MIHSFTVGVKLMPVSNMPWDILSYVAIVLIEISGIISKNEFLSSRDKIFHYMNNLKACFPFYQQ